MICNICKALDKTKDDRDKHDRAVTQGADSSQSASIETIVSQTSGMVTLILNILYCAVVEASALKEEEPKVLGLRKLCRYCTDQASEAHLLLCCT